MGLEWKGFGLLDKSSEAGLSKLFSTCTKETLDNVFFEKKEQIRKFFLDFQRKLFSDFEGNCFVTVDNTAFYLTIGLFWDVGNSEKTF